MHHDDQRTSTASDCSRRGKKRNFSDGTVTQDVDARCVARVTADTRCLRCESAVQSREVARRFLGTDHVLRPGL